MPVWNRLQKKKCPPPSSSNVVSTTTRFGREKAMAVFKDTGSGHTRRRVHAVEPPKNGLTTLCSMRSLGCVPRSTGEENCRARSTLRSKPVYIIACIWVLAFAPALAAQTLAAPDLKPEMASLAYFQGAWSCEGAFSSGEKISADLIFRSDLDGAWLLLRHDDRPPNVFHAVGLWGFDKAQNRSVHGGSRDEMDIPLIT